MGLWSAIKGVVRQVVRVVVEVVNRLTVGIFDQLFGFAGWPRKKLRLQVIILADASGPVVPTSDLQAPLDFITRVFDERFDVKVVPFGHTFVQAMKDPAPDGALDYECSGAAWYDEFGTVGDFFAKHLAGWNAIPVGVRFPVTVYVTRNVEGTQGCSLGPLTDYVVIDLEGVATPSLMAHEVLHACGIWHSRTRTNFAYHPSDRGEGAKWFQKNMLRASRHVQFW